MESRTAEGWLILVPAGGKTGPPKVFEKAQAVGVPVECLSVRKPDEEFHRKAEEGKGGSW